MLLFELFERIQDPKQAVLDAALAALHHRVSSKGDQQTIDGYAFDIVRSFDIGLSARQLAALYRDRYSVVEGYRLQLERDDAVLVLNITDTNTGKRTEVRGKPGYETSGYDPNDKLHMLLDKIGKTANISELINGETVTINPKHPDAERAKSATHRAFNESLDQPYPYRWGVQDDYEWVARAETESGAILDIRFEYGDWDAEWVIEFTLDGGYKATAAGDQFRIFATVVKVIKEWWKSTSTEGLPVQMIRFSADKLNDKTGRTGSREKLYNRFAQQFANSIGFTLQRSDAGNATDFELINPNYSKRKVTEALDQPYSYKWVDQEDHEWEAVAPLPRGLDLRIRFEKDRDNIWDIEFLLGKTLRATGEGDQYRIFATVVKAVTEWAKWLLSSKQPVRAIHFSAIKDDEQDTGRARLYNRFAKQLAGGIGFDYENLERGLITKFILSNPNYSKRKVSEALDQPYPVEWNLQADDEWFAWAKDNKIQIQIKTGGNRHWTIRFKVNETMDKTGEGDEFRIFATVKAAIQQWWTWASKNAEVDVITFSAEKIVDSSRSRLYNRFAKQFASAIGYDMEVVTGRATDIFYLKKPGLEENFADGKVKGKSRPGRVKRAGASCNGSVTSLRKRAKNSSGEKAKMYHWCANMKSGRKKS